MKKADVLAFYGTAAAAARALGIKPEAVYQWGEKIPQLRAYEYERITGGKLKADPSAKSRKH